MAAKTIKRHIVVMGKKAGRLGLAYSFQRSLAVLRIAEALKKEALEQGIPPAITFEEEQMGSWDDVVERTRNGSATEVHTWQAKSGVIGEVELQTLLDDLLAHPEITRATLVLAHCGHIGKVGTPSQLVSLLRRLDASGSVRALALDRPAEAWLQFLRRVCHSESVLLDIARRLHLLHLTDEGEIEQKTQDVLGQVYEQSCIAALSALLYQLVGRSDGSHRFMPESLRAGELASFEERRLATLPGPQRHARRDYLETLRRALERRPILKGLLLEKTTVAEAWVPVKVVPKGVPWASPVHLEDTSPGLHVIVGEAGSGKTELLAATARTLTDLALASPEAPMPLLLELRGLSGTEDQALCSAAKQLAPDIAAALAVLLRSSSSRWTLLVDGLDEAPVMGPALVDALHDRFAGSPLLVSTRPGFEGTVEPQDTYCLEPWTPAEALALVGKLGPLSLSSPQLAALLEGGTLFERPLTATLAAFALRQGAPLRNRTTLMDFVVKRVLQAWPREHGRPLDWRELARPIRRFALASVRDEAYLVSPQDLTRLAHQVAPDDEVRFEEALCRDFGLLVPRDGGYAFALRPLAEFLAGQELKEQGDEERQKRGDGSPLDTPLRHAARHAWGAEPTRYAIGLLVEEKRARRAGRLLLGLARPLKGDRWRLMSLRRLLVAIHATADAGEALRMEAYALAKVFAWKLRDEASPWRSDRVADAVRELARNGGPCWEALRDTVGLSPPSTFAQPQVASGAFLGRRCHDQRPRFLQDCEAVSQQGGPVPPACMPSFTGACVRAPLLPQLTDPRTPAQFYRGLTKGIGSKRFWLVGLAHSEADVREEAVHRLAGHVNNAEVQTWLFQMLGDDPWPGIPESRAVPALAAGLALRHARRTPSFKANLPWLVEQAGEWYQLESAAAAIALRPHEASALLLARAMHRCAQGGYPVPRLPIDELAATSEGKSALEQVWGDWHTYNPTRLVGSVPSPRLHDASLPLPLSILTKRRMVQAMLPACLRRSPNETHLTGLLHAANPSSLLHLAASQPELLLGFLNEYPHLLLGLPPDSQDLLGRALSVSAALQVAVQRQWESLESSFPHRLGLLPGRALEPLVSGEHTTWSESYARWLPHSPYAFSTWKDSFPAPRVLDNKDVAAVAQGMIEDAWHCTTEGEVDEHGHRRWLAPLACAGIFDRFPVAWRGRQEVVEQGLAWLRSPDINARNGGSLLLRRALLSEDARHTLVAAVRDSLTNRLPYDYIARPALIQLIRSQVLVQPLEPSLRALVHSRESIALPAAVALTDVLRGEDAAAVASRAAAMGLSHFIMETLTDRDMARLVALAPAVWEQATLHRIETSTLEEDTLARLLPAFTMAPRRRLLRALLRRGHAPLPWRRKENWGLPYRPLERVLEMAFEAGLNVRPDGIPSSLGCGSTPRANCRAVAVASRPL